MPTLGLAAANIATRRSHTTPNPFAGISFAGSNQACGVDPVLGKLWVYSGSVVSQADSLTATTFTALSLPANINPAGQQVKIVTFTPAGGSPLMFLCSWNTSTSRYEVYSAPPVAAGTAPTWSGPLLTLPANATLMPPAFRATSGGLLVGEYSGGSDIAGGPSLWRSTDGAAFSRVLGPLATTRHIHGIYEDPFNPGAIYATVGDYFPPYTPPYALYRSTDGGANFTGAANVTSRIWQAVGMGFTADYVWCLSDQYDGGGPFLLDRATLTPRWATTKSRHDQIAVPGGVGGRVITDAGFSSNSNLASPAQAQFTQNDVGRTLGGSTSVQLGAVITAVASATAASMSINAMTSFAGQTLVIGGDKFFANAYAGAIDPASGWLYLVANDTSGPGTTAGVFVLPGPDAPFTLLYTLPNAFINRNEAYIAGGYLFIDRHRLPLLTGTS